MSLSDAATPRQRDERSERSALTGRQFWIAAAIFTALTVVLTWPQVIRLQSIYPHEDSLFNIWRLAWVAHAMRTNPLELFQANIFWPERDTLAYSDAIVFEGVLATPLLWAGVPTPIVQSLLILASFIFSGCAAFVLGRHLTGRFGAGLLAGLVFAFAPFRFDHYMHLELLWSGWMPLAMLALLRAFEENSVRWGMATAALTLMQVLSAIYYGVFLILTLGLMATVLWAGRAAGTRRALAGLTLGGLLAGVVLVPYLQPYRRAREVVGERPLEAVRFYSAGPTQLLGTTPGNWLYGPSFSRFGRHEKRLFAGAVGLALTIVGLWPPFDRRRIALAAGLGMAVYLSIGANAPGFLTLREHVEVFRGLRAPARAGQLVLLFIGVLAAYGLVRLQSWLQARRFAVAPYAPALCASVLVLEYAAMPVALLPAPSPSPSSVWLADQPAGVVAELPMPTGVDRTHEPEVIYQSTFHWHKLVNGHSGNLPRSNAMLYQAVETLPSPEGLEALKRAGVRYIIVHEAWYGPPTYRVIVEFFNARPDLTLRATFSNGEYAIAAYEVKP